MVTVLIAGHVNWDVTLRVDRLPEPDGESKIRTRRQSGGGSAANVATALSSLGIHAELVGSVGVDSLGELARHELEEAGVSVDGLREIQGAETAVKYLLVDDEGEVSVLGNDGANEAITPEDVDAARVQSADHVHLTSQRPETAGYLAETASEAGVPVSVDLGRRLGDRNYERALAHADVIFATDREAQTLLETTDVQADERDVDRDHVFVVTRGADGAEVYTPDGRYVYPAFEIDAVDTAGAGDAFAAGFIAKTLEERVEGRLLGRRRESEAGREIEPEPTRNREQTLTLADDRRRDRILEYANACGALAASNEGARSTPDRVAVRDVLESRE